MFSYLISIILVHNSSNKLDINMNNQLNWQIVACSGYCYGVDTWHTLSTKISFSTCTCQHCLLAI